MTHEEILEDYPDLEREDILAVLDYAARAPARDIGGGGVHPPPQSPRRLNNIVAKRPRFSC